MFFSSCTYVLVILLSISPQISDAEIDIGNIAKSALPAIVVIETPTSKGSGVIIDNSGDNGQADVLTYQVNYNSTIFDNLTTDLDPSGALNFDAEIVDISLGVLGDTFYIPATDSAISLSLQTGLGFDTVYVGTTPGNESAGS